MIGNEVEGDGGVNEPPTPEEWAECWAEGTFDPPLARGEMGNAGDAVIRTGSRPLKNEHVERYYGILLSGFLSLVLSGVLTLIALEFSRAWLVAWGTGFVLGWPLAVILVALFGGRIRRLAMALARRVEVAK